MKNESELQIDSLLKRGVSEVIDEKHLRERLLSGKKLRVKFGVDPTSPDIHLGRAVVLMKLRDFQELGHTIVFIIGDFTGVIGDTSDKESERPMLTSEEVNENMKSYFEQAGKLLDMNAVEKHYNSEWLGKLTYKEIAQQADNFSLSEFSARENIKRRSEKGSRISLRELLYPLMQGFDSVAVQSDVELGGTDQRFNLLAGRKLQEYYGQNPQDVLMTNLILGTDGRKMSSSWRNTINITEDPKEIFGKVMSIPDDLIESYALHCTRIAQDDIAKITEAMRKGELNPRDAKFQVAKEIVATLYSLEESEKAAHHFEHAVSNKGLPDDIREFTVSGSCTMVDFLISAGMAESKGDARRKIDQGGVTLDGNKIESPALMLERDKHHGAIIKVGKRHYCKILFSE